MFGQERITVNFVKGLDDLDFVCIWRYPLREMSSFGIISFEVCKDVQISVLWCQLMRIMYDFVGYLSRFRIPGNEV